MSFEEAFQTDINLFKVKNGESRAIGEICSELTKKPIE